MSAIMETAASVAAPSIRSGAEAMPAGRPARAAATRAGRAGMALSALGVAASLFVVVRLFETWRIGPHARTHQVTVLGLRMSYPAANVDALIILGLAFVGFVVTATVVIGAAREFLAARRFHRRLASSGPTRLADAFLIEDDEPLAFCAGLLRPRVYVSTGALALLDAKALEAVLVHERHHATRRDPLRLAAARVVAGALFFLPWLGRLHRHERSLAELGADESVLHAAPENRSALARAMLSFAEHASAGVAPERVDYVLGETPSWSFPALLCVASLLTIGLIVAVAILVGRLAAASATFALPILSSQPCVVMLALIPACGAVFAVSRSRP